MSASRVVKWGTAAVLVLAVTAFAYAGVAAGQSPSSGHWGPPSGPTYNVTFKETGLVSGTNWTVEIGHGGWGWGWGFGHHHQKTNGTSMVFSLPNGTYRYSVEGVSGYKITNGSHGWFEVQGAALPAINVTFVKLHYYAVTFSETGLTSGTHWTVRVATIGPWGHVRVYGHTTNQTSMTFSLLNGSYVYRVLPVPGYKFQGSDSHGTFNVTGASPAVISVVFVKLPTYSVVFNETGLPAGTNWTVTSLAWHGGYVTGRSDQTTLTLQLWNGTYLYHIGHVPGYYVVGGPWGIVTVSGSSPPVIDVTFAAYPSSGANPVPLAVVN